MRPETVIGGRRPSVTALSEKLEAMTARSLSGMSCHPNRRIAT